jgi:chemotaxis protein CheD
MKVPSIWNPSSYSARSPVLLVGSCARIAIYDPVTRVGGLLHAMLPDLAIDLEKAARKPAVFLDTGIPVLFRAADELRAEKLRVHICVVGGAQIMDSSGLFNLGKRNSDAVTALFPRHGLRSVAEEFGGLVNRTMYLNLATGQLNLKVSGQTEEVALCNR